MIDADKLRNEIADFIRISSKYDNDFAQGGKYALEMVLKIVGSLISEQEPPK